MARLGSEGGGVWRETDGLTKGEGIFHRELNLQSLAHHNDFNLSAVKFLSLDCT